MLYSYSNFDRICLLQKTRCWRCRYLSSYIICWMSSPKVASRQRSRLFKLADFQLWHTWNFHEGNSAYIAKVFLTSETKLVKSQQSKYGLFQFDEFLKFWSKMSNFWIFTFPKSLPNGEEGDPRLESEAKFLINCKGDEENGELLWIFGVWGFGGRFSSLFSIFTRYLSIF